MEELTKEGYRDLINKAGLVTRFYISQIDDIWNNKAFYEAFKEIQARKNIKISENNNIYSTPMRFIDRGNETLCLIKKVSEDDDYEDKIVYYLTVDFNKKIRIEFDYKDLIINHSSDKEINFAILEDYSRDDCGNIYGNGKVINTQEMGYKGKIYSNKKNVILEYINYKNNNVTVIFPEKQYEYNYMEPDENINKTTKCLKMTKGINNPSFLAYNELHELKLKSKQKQRRR